jgi:uncharacterized membrane protein
VFIYLATYADRADADADYATVLDLHERKVLDSYDVAVVSKDAEGKVHVQKHEKPTQRGIWGGVLVGALVGVVLPPALIGVAAVGGAAAVGGIVGGLGGHFLEGMSRGDVKELGDLLESGRAALIVIGESSAAQALEEALTHPERFVEKEIVADREQLKQELEKAERELAGS